MLRTHDDWERLVAAVLKKQQLWELCHAHSRSPSLLSEASSSSDLSPNSSFREIDNNASIAYWQALEEDAFVAGIENPARKLVLVSNFVPAFDAEDISFSSLEPLGRGTFCDTYVGDVKDGVRIVVKRVNRQVSVSEEEFKRSMDVAGRVGHENVVALRAYCCSEDEKLMLYDYYSEGSVHQLLHGKMDEGPANDVGWEARLRIAVGAACGLASIHSQNLVHGNVKSSNIFLNSERYGCISDHGIANLTSAAKLMKSALCYAPEVKNSTQNCSQESDVYSFGILLFELLTRKSPVPIPGGPEAVDLVGLMKSAKSKQMTPKVFDADLLQHTSIREQMVKVLQIGISCVVKTAKKRPKMSEVAKMLDDLQTRSGPKNGSLVFVHSRITNSLQKSRIGVLSFEAASLMTKLLHLWQLLTDEQVGKMRQQITNSSGIKKFVSEDDDDLGNLICSEISGNLMQVGMSVRRLSKKCYDPRLRDFEQAFIDFVLNGNDHYAWQLSWKKMEEKSKKMERFVIANTNFYQEMEIIADLEEAFKRTRGSGNEDSVTLVEYEKKVARQLQVAKHHKNNSLWNRTFDYVVLLLARSVFTVYGRISHVFEAVDNTNAADVHNNGRFNSRVFMQSSVYLSEIYLPRFSSGPSTFKLWHFFKKTSNDVAEKAALRKKPNGLVKYGRQMTSGNSFPLLSNISLYSGGIEDPNLTPPPGTLGAAALALHYANLIILIEKLVPASHLIVNDARGDLYSMLPNSIRAALRARLKPYAMSLSSSVYDMALASEWKEAITAILGWLAPLAHNTVRWQSERSYEKKNLAPRRKLLLVVQTLYFANQEKTEAAITELLVGLNYVMRFGG